MNRIKSFGAFWYDFVIGDDWHVAALVVAGLALTAILVRAAHVNAWWLLPLFVFAALGWSLHRATSKELFSERKVAPLPATWLFKVRCVGLAMLRRVQSTPESGAERRALHHFAPSLLPVPSRPTAAS